MEPSDTALAPAAFTQVSKQGDLAMHPAGSAVADPPSSMGHVGCASAACAMSVVAVGSITDSTLPTIYCTGFILVSEEKYSVIFTSLPPKAQQSVTVYYVYFEQGKYKVQAKEFLADTVHRFAILVAKTDKHYPVVSFRNDPPDNEYVFTIGSMSGTKLHANAANVMDELIGHLGIYPGEVITPNCAAVDFLDDPENGSEMYFEVTCDVQDHIVTLLDIDKDRKTFTSQIVRSAPVFSLSNEVIGLIFSHGTWNDVKVGLLSDCIITFIKKMCGGEDWESLLKKGAEEELNYKR